MRSVRLGQELEAQLEEAAQITGEPVSEIIRDAVRRRCDEVLGGRLDRRLADVIGVVSAGGNSRKTGQAFAELLRRNGEAKQKRKPARRGTAR